MEEEKKKQYLKEIDNTKRQLKLLLNESNDVTVVLPSVNSSDDD